MNRFEAAVMAEEPILAKGAVIERIRRHGEMLDEHVRQMALKLVNKIGDD